jgi:propanediol dehydratase small subunit
MAQWQQNNRPNGRLSANHRTDDQPITPEITQQRRELVTQLGETSFLIEQNVRDLTQPMSVILDLNNVILPQIEPGSKLAADLLDVTKQIKRLSHIVNEVNNLVEERKKLLKTMGTLQSSSTKQESGERGNY